MGVSFSWHPLCLFFYLTNWHVVIWTEKGNEDYKYGEKDTVRVAGQQNFDNF
jgi:hypothetical protein